MTRSLSIAALVSVLAGCPGPTPPPDAPADDAPRLDVGVPCTMDADCDDGRFCTGEESCVMGRCAAGADPCDDGIECTIDSCSETRMRCTSEPPDEDGDGAGSMACVDGSGMPLGDDCDDANADRYPGAAEICDGEDEDCVPATLGGIDDDGDGYVSSACCDGTNCGPDCDDARLGSFPGATEVCDGLDQDCNGTVDDGLTIPSYPDADRDGWGAVGAATMDVCPGTPGFSDQTGDCNDDPMSPNARAQSPGQPEICDGIRNDCDDTMMPDVGAGAVDWYGDADGDGFGSPASGVTRSCTPVADASLLRTDCNDTDPMVSPAATERCNAEDDNCDGLRNYRIAAGDFEDDDLDGLVDTACPGGTDCNDTDPGSGPGEPERCDMRDNDCDTTVDEGATSAIYYRDLDRDGFGSLSSGTVVACMALGGYVPNAGDCNDADPTRYPGAAETCDAADEDCDAAVDEAPASVSCMPSGASLSTCVAGRCVVDECLPGRGDCDGRGSNGCEVDLSSNRLHCAGCGVFCPGAGVCGGGLCTRSYASVAPPESSLPVPRVVDFTIDTPASGMTIAYTRDGSLPGVSPSTMTGTTPLVIAAGGESAEEIRYRIVHAPGIMEDPQHFAAVLAPALGIGNVVEHVNIDSSGPLAVVRPGATVSVTYDVQAWHAQPGQFCETCTVYMSLNVPNGTGGLAVGDCLPTVSIGFSYPGTTYTGRSFTFTAPTTPGTYPIVIHTALDFDCRPSGGPEVGRIVVAP